MNSLSEKIDRVVDSHVHMFKLASTDKMVELCEHVGLARMNLLSIVNPRNGSGNGEVLCAKSVGGGRFYGFGGLNHAAAGPGGQAQAPPLAQQLEELLAAGCDGIKLIEGKPSHRKQLPEPLDGAYYADFFARAAELATPLLWHVADPEEFWDPALLPDWAARRNWGYDATDVPKEQLHDEVAAVLASHPKLRVLLAHFYFLSADLPRATEFLAAHPAVSIDLAPGVEFLYNLTRTLDEAREFFIAQQGRIIFGTDIADSNSPVQANVRAQLVRRFLETDDTFTVPAEADDLLAPGGPTEIHGLDLPADVLANIYAANFEALAGPEPKAVDVAASVALCRREAETATAVSGTPAGETPAGRCADALEAVA